MKQTISVGGMTCENCARHVTQALGEIPGVGSVTVDLAKGNATFDSDLPVEPQRLAAALDEAGYQLA